jgi:transcriptional regulator with XRE-family HTH domain
MQEGEIAASLAGRLRKERELRRWSIEELAGRSGVSRAMISKLERGESSPTAALLGRLSGAFSLTMSQLLHQVERDAGVANGQVSRVSEQRMWQDPATGLVRRLLTPSGGEGPLELVWVELPGHAEVAYPAEAYRFLEDQQIIVLEGDLEFVQGEQYHELGPGDCMRLGPPEDCSFRNRRSEPCRYIVAVLRRQSF